MKCTDCKWYVADAPQEVELVVKTMGGGIGVIYDTRKIYKRCSLWFKDYGRMRKCFSNNKNCFEPKSEVIRKVKVK